MGDVTYDTPELADHYDKISNAQFRLGRLLIEKMGVKEGDVILDVGCGTGRLALSVLKIVGPSGKVIGLDPISNRILVANKKVSDHNYPNLHFMIGVGEDLGAFSEATFDEVYFSSVFHWIPEKEKALGEAYRVLKSGGKIGISMPSPDGFSAVLGRIISDILSRPPYAGHVKKIPTTSHLISKSKLELLLTQSQFIDLVAEVKEMKMFHQSADELIDFYKTSSHANILQVVPEELHGSLQEDIIRELERRRTSEGIELVSKTIYAIAKKP